MDNTVLTAVIFPGQGSQEKNMGRDLAEAFPDAMELWKLAEKITNHPLREIYWDGDDADMANTEWLQPALTVVDLGFWLYLASKITPSAFAGHSLGEFPALAAARVLEVEDTIRLTALRGRLMSQAGGGGKMAAILKLGLEGVGEIVESAVSRTGKALSIANYNSPAQHVITGDAEAVDAAMLLVKEMKGRGVLLPVSGAFHSPAMNDAAKEFKAYLNKLDWRAPVCPVFLNVTGEAERSPEKIRDTVAVQMTSGVRWTQTILNMWSSGIRRYVESGPKGVLTRLIPAILDKQPADGYTSLSIDSKEKADSLA